MFLEGKQFYYKYDLDSTSYKYGRLGDNTGLPVQGSYGVKTSGSSTTVTSDAAGVASTFAGVAVGDVIVFEQPPDTKLVRKVATVVDNGEITVDTAVNLGAGGASFFRYPWKIGTTTAFGWHPVQAYSAITLWVALTTLGHIDGVDISIEGLAPNLLGPAGAVVLFSQQYTATGTFSINVGEVTGALRVGVKGHTAATGTDDISIWMTGEIRTQKA